MKKKKTCKIPAYAFGVDTAEAIGKGAAGLMDQFIGGSSAQTTGQAVAQSVTDIANMGVTGMQIGSALGPIGAVVGGVAGAATGLIGRKGKVTQTKGYLEDDQYTLGTGLIGAFNNKKIRRQIDESKRNVNANRVAFTNTNQLQNEWNSEYDYDVNTYAQGGLSSSLAYVDDGELIQTPNGQISKVPEQNKPTDSNLVNLPEGSRILSDKLKVPGTKKTFAQLGEEMMKKRKSRGKDRYAENSAKLNEMNNNIIHDQLFQLQETVKNKRGIKNKAKAFDLGGVMKKVGAIGEEISILAPTISNLISTPEESVAPVYNPYASTIDRTMRSRRYNITPAINALKNNRVVGDYNANQMNTGTGANLAYRLQTATGLNNSISDLYSQASNIQNQYDADYASTLNNLGQQYVGATNLARDTNARNRAMNRNIRRAGLSQISEYTQNRQLMRNQKFRDEQLFPLYRKFLESGYTEEDLRKFLKGQ